MTRDELKQLDLRMDWGTPAMVDSDRDFAWAGLDLRKAADLPFGAFARWMRMKRDIAFGHPPLTLEMEADMARLEAETPAAALYRPYLERRVFAERDRDARVTERAAAAATMLNELDRDWETRQQGVDSWRLEQAFEEFTQRVHDHAAGLRLPVSDWIDWSTAPEEDYD
jgi:hypothetical protein